MKKLTELTPEELKTLFHNNKHLQQVVLNYSQDDIFMYIGDILKPFEKMHGVDYSISNYNDYFTVKENAFCDFLEGVEEMQTAYCILSDDTFKQVTRALKKADFYTDILEGYQEVTNKTYNNLFKWFSGIVHIVTSEILKHCQDDIMYYYDNNNLCAYFLEMIDSFDYFQTDGKKLYELKCYA